MKNARKRITEKKSAKVIEHLKEFCDDRREGLEVLVVACQEVFDQLTEEEDCEATCISRYEDAFLVIGSANQIPEAFLQLCKVAEDAARENEMDSQQNAPAETAFTH
jgi:hypothetical protein